MTKLSTKLNKAKVIVMKTNTQKLGCPKKIPTKKTCQK